LVDREPGDAGPAGDLADADLGGRAPRDELARRGQDRLSRPVDELLAASQPVRARHHNNLTGRLSNQLDQRASFEVTPAESVAGPTSYHPSL
jgi:hypothetical protein